MLGSQCQAHDAANLSVRHLLREGCNSQCSSATHGCLVACMLLLGDAVHLAAPPGKLLKTRHVAVSVCALACFAHAATGI